MKKTNSGKNIIISIHPKRQHFILKRIKENKFLILVRKIPERKMQYKYSLDVIFNAIRKVIIDMTM